jgi:hypothetical protein
VRLLRRIVVTLVGGALLILGTALLILPGPGLIVVAAGFLILGVEYPWARRRAVVVRDRAWRSARKAAASPMSTMLAAFAGACLVAAGFCWGLIDGLPAASWWVGGSLIFSGVAALATLAASLVVVRRELRPR